MGGSDRASALEPGRMGRSIGDAKKLTSVGPHPGLRWNLREAELRQYRKPVGSGPSSNTCPRWEPQLAHSTSTRRMNKLRSSFSCTWSFCTGAQKLGQPVPESNFVCEANSSCPQTTHA